VRHQRHVVKAISVVRGQVAAVADNQRVIGIGLDMEGSAGRQ
jgi:hypothetical protein